MLGPTCQRDRHLTEIKLIFSIIGVITPNPGCRVHPAPYPNHLSPPYLKEDLKPLPKPLAILARGLQPLLLVAVCAEAQYLIPENTEGFCRAAGGEEPPKSEGGMERALKRAGKPS